MEKQCKTIFAWASYADSLRAQHSEVERSAGASTALSGSSSLPRETSVTELKTRVHRALESVKNGEALGKYFGITGEIPLQPEREAERSNRLFTRLQSALDEGG